MVVGRAVELQIQEQIWYLTARCKYRYKNKYGNWQSSGNTDATTNMVFERAMKIQIQQQIWYLTKQCKYILPAK